MTGSQFLVGGLEMQKARELAQLTGLGASEVRNLGDVVPPEWLIRTSRLGFLRVGQ